MASSVLCLLLLCPPAWAETWPEDSAWQAVQHDGADLADACDDVSGNAWWDVVGDGARPAAFWAREGELLWFRLRLRDAPQRDTGGSTTWRSFSWGVLVESDWSIDEVGYDQAVYVDGTSDEVLLVDNDERSAPFASDSAETLVASYDGSAAESGSPEAASAGWLAAGSDVCGGSGDSVDYFVDWAVPWGDLAALAGVADPADLAFTFGTSSTAGSLSKDVAGFDGDPASADWWGSGSDSDVDTDGDGLSSQDEVELHGTDPHAADTDEGGVDDGTEVGRGSDPLDPSDDDGAAEDGGAADGGAADGGAADGGAADGGIEEPATLPEDTGAAALGSFIGGACQGCGQGGSRTSGLLWSGLLLLVLSSRGPGRRRSAPGAGARGCRRPR